MGGMSSSTAARPFHALKTVLEMIKFG